MKTLYEMIFILLIGFSFTIAAPPQTVDNDERVCDPVCCDRYSRYDEVKGYCTLDWDMMMENADEKTKLNVEELKHNLHILQENMNKAISNGVRNFLIAVVITVIICVVFACIYYWKRKNQKSQRAQDITVPLKEEEKKGCEAVVGQFDVKAV